MADETLSRLQAQQYHANLNNRLISYRILIDNTFGIPPWWRVFLESLSMDLQHTDILVLARCSLPKMLISIGKDWLVINEQGE